MIIMITITITLLIIIRFPKASQCDRLPERRRLEQEGIAFDKVETIWIIMLVVVVITILIMMVVRIQEQP